MNTKIQELTQKIYQEGVEKGNTEAQQIVEQAEKQKASMLKEAGEMAEKIVAEAHKQAEELKKNAEAELKLYAGQAVSVLKSEITDLICGQVVKSAVDSTLQEKEFMSQFLLTMAQEWGKRESIVIEAKEAETLTNFFASKAKALLDNGLKIEQINGKKSSFTIAPANNAYKIAIGEAEFKAYFESFLRPQLVELLFK